MAGDIAPSALLCSCGLSASSSPLQRQTWKQFFSHFWKVFHSVAGLFPFSFLESRAAFHGFVCLTHGLKGQAVEVSCLVWPLEDHIPRSRGVVAIQLVQPFQAVRFCIQLLAANAVTLDIVVLGRCGDVQPSPEEQLRTAQRSGCEFSDP